MGNKLGDLPTVELRRDELARYAREADKRALESDSEATRATKPPPGRSSEVEISVEVVIDGEADAAEPELDAVPYVVASREDLSWFELEETSNVVLAKIDGTMSVEAIVLSLPIPSEKTLAVFRELHAHGVIEFH